MSVLRRCALISRLALGAIALAAIIGAANGRVLTNCRATTLIADPNDSRCVRPAAGAPCLSDTADPNGMRGEDTSRCGLKVVLRRRWCPCGRPAGSVECQ